MDNFLLMHTYKSVGINLKSFLKKFHGKPYLEKNDKIVNEMLSELFF